LADKYVDPVNGEDNVAATNDGSTEAKAYRSLIKALDNAGANDTVWLKGGTGYKYDMAIIHSGSPPASWDQATETLTDGAASFGAVDNLVGKALFLVDAWGTFQYALTITANTNTTITCAGLDVSPGDAFTSYYVTENTYPGLEITAGGGVVNQNQLKKIKAYHDYNPADHAVGISDMDVGGDYYQSAYDAEINGVDLDCCADFDGGGSLGENILKFMFVENMKFDNCYFHGTNKGTDKNCVYITSSNDIHFNNCKTNTGFRNYSGDCERYVLTGCWTGTDIAVQPIIVTSSSPVLIKDCVINGIATRHTIGAIANGVIINNLFLNGRRVVYPGAAGQIKFINNTCYNQDEVCLRLSVVKGLAYNNIFYLAASSNHVVSILAAGGAYEGDYNCWYVATTFGITYDADGETPIPGNNTINEDPQFADEANKDFTPRNPNVIYGGKPDYAGNPTQMGAILKRPRPTVGFGGGFG